MYVTTWAVLHVKSTGDDDSQIGPQDANKFQIVVWISLGFGIFCTLIFHCFVREDNNGAGTDVRGSELQIGVTELLCNIKMYQVSHAKH